MPPASGCHRGGRRPPWPTAWCARARATWHPTAAAPVSGARGVVGGGATSKRPMVSWGTTASVSVPLSGGRYVPTEAQVSVGALGGYVQEAGLSSSGAAIGWVESITGWSRDDLMTSAAEV